MLRWVRAFTTDTYMNGVLTMKVIHIACALAIVTCALESAQAGTLTPIVDAPGADPFSTNPTGINDFGIVGGGYTTGSGAVEHGFVGPPGGPYATFDYLPSDFVTPATEVRALNNSGDAVGIIYGIDILGVPGASFREFLRIPSGTFVTLTDPATGNPLSGIAQGINSAGFIVGDYDTPDGSGGLISRGFILSPDRKILTTLSDPLAATAPVGCGAGRIPHGGTRARGINDSGTVSGFYFDASCVGHGFLYDISSGIYTTLDHPLASGAAGTTPGHRGGTGTYLPGINNAGQIAGQYTDAPGNYHGFLLDATHTQFTEIKAPGATYTQVFGINNLGQATVASDAGGFIWSPSSTGTPTDVLLPVTASRGRFHFRFHVFANVTYYIDPQLAVGYDYQTGAGNPNFAAVTPPGSIGGGTFELWICDGLHHCADSGFDPAGGSSFNFLTNGWPGGVSEFRLVGINRNARINPNDPTAFVTGVDFVAAGNFTGTMTSLCSEELESGSGNQYFACGSGD